MESIFSTIFLGVISGVLTTVFLYIFFLFFRKIFEPWFEERLYKGVKISGGWVANVTTKTSPGWSLTIFINLEQKANKITGSFQAKTVRSSGEEYINFYKIKGDVRDNFLLLNYAALPSDRTGIGSFLLRVAHGGLELRGVAAYIADGDSDELTTIEDLKFLRSKK